MCTFPWIEIGKSEKLQESSSSTHGMLLPQTRTPIALSYSSILPAAGSVAQVNADVPKGCAEELLL